MPDTPTLTGAAWTPEPGAIVFLPEITTGFTDDEIARLFTGTAGLTAAIEAHDGAMVAFIPATEDVVELARPGGEPIAQMHVTAFYLGEASAVDENDRAAIHAAVADLAERQPIIIGELFGFSVWNPAGPEPCIVADVQGVDLEDAHSSVEVTLDDIEFAYPDQHRPWRPHITLAYGTTEIDEDLLVKTGPISFDRIRVAFGGVSTDYPLQHSG